MWTTAVLDVMVCCRPQRSMMSWSAADQRSPWCHGLLWATAVYDVMDQCRPQRSTMSWSATDHSSPRCHIFRQKNHCRIYMILTTREAPDPKVMGTIKLAHWDASFGTMQSQIRWTVMEILESKYKNNFKQQHFSVIWYPFSPLEGHLTPKLMVPLWRSDKKLPKIIGTPHLILILSELQPFV